MKRIIMMAVALALLITLALPASMLAEDFPGNNWATYFTYTYETPDGGPMTVELIAGQHYDVGYVRVWNTGATLFVEYYIDVDDLYILETHVAVAGTLDDIPQKNGNPRPGKFPYKAEYDLGDEVTNPDPFQIPLDDYTPGATLYVATHAALSNGETAWTGEEEPEPAIDIEKYVSVDGGVTWHDADTAPGPSAVVGDPVYFKYEVTNPGDVPLSGVIVVDDNGTPGNLADDVTLTLVSGDDGDGLLENGEIWLYEASGTAIEGLYTNIAEVTGYYESEPYTDSDPANYTGTIINIVNWYIGYEDWTNGDFDYNDFGMYFSATEIYNGDNNLTQVTLTFSAQIYDAGADHLIHITRNINGDSTYTVTRGVAAYGGETPASSYAGSGDIDVVLFDTTKYIHPEKQMNELVTVDIIIDDPSLNPKVTPVAPRWDVDGFMADYDPWLEVIDGGSSSIPVGTEWHIIDTQVVASLDNGDASDALLDYRLVGQELPFILVVPVENWIPPYETSSISGPRLSVSDYGPYGYFYDYYNTTGASHSDWYAVITDSYVGLGGLSW